MSRCRICFRKVCWLPASRATALQIKFRWKEMFPRDAKEMYAAANQKSPVKEAMKRMKRDDRDEHSGWSAATAPMRKPGVSSARTPFTAPARGGIGGLGETVFKVSQSRCLWPPPQKRQGPILASYGLSTSGRHPAFFTRLDVSAFVTMRLPHLRRGWRQLP